MDRFKILKRYILVGSITKPEVMFAEASPTLRIESTFPQGIQKPALTPFGELETFLSEISRVRKVTGTLETPLSGS